MQELRRASHVSRAAITRPHVAVQVLMPDTDVQAAATEMVTAAYRMRDAATSTEDLTAAREAARTAHDRFVSAAATYMQTA
ncbi:hypothetical protein ACPEIF_20175 [Streptomyces sp. NPDC012600]|uniref:hypothetical protein n=1 Tax=Streptomyces sp. NPDC012600 TaxID=3415005 RepID=UPI003C2F6BD8